MHETGKNPAVTENAFAALTGFTTNTFTVDGDARTRALAIRGNLNQGIPMTVGTKDPPAGWGDSPYIFDSSGMIADHAYTIVGIEVPASGTSGIYVTLRNPWASDTSWRYFDADSNDSLSGSEWKNYQRGLDGNDDGLIRVPWSQFAANASRVVAAWQVKGPPSNRPLPAPPIFGNPNLGPYSIRAGETLGPLNVSASAPNGDGLFYSLEKGSRGYVNQDGQYTWQPGPNDVGTFDVTIIAENWNSLASAALTFQVTVADGSPRITSLSASPSSIRTDGTDLLTLTANGVSTPVGSVDHVKFFRDANRNSILDSDDVYLGRDDSSSGGWNWSGYVGGIQTGTQRFFAQAVAYTFTDSFLSNAASASVTVTAAPYVPPAAVAIVTEQLASPAAAYSQIAYKTTRDSAGNIYAFWNTNQVVNGSTVQNAYMRKFNASGSPLTDPILLRANTAFHDVAMMADGSFAAVYGSISIQYYNSSGESTGPVFSKPVSNPSGVKVAADANGNLLIAYHTGDYFAEDVYAMSFSKIGSFFNRNPWRVHSSTTGMQKFPSVALNADGTGLIAWTDGAQGDVVYRRVTNHGANDGPMETANQITDGDALGDTSISVAVNASGAFVIAWTAYDGTTNGNEVFVRRFGSTGIPQGAEVKVNTQPGNTQWRPQAAVNDRGWFVVAWDSFNQDPGTNPDYGVYAQMFAPSGEKAGGEFRVNGSTAYAQTLASVVIDPDSDATFLWNHGGDGNPTKTYLRPYRTNLAPVFQNPASTFSIPEGASTGFPVGNMLVADPDGNALAFSILDASPFAITGAGAIVVANGSLLDFETTSRYEIRVRVTDNGSPAHSDTTTVVVNLRNVSEAPKMQQATFTLAEWSPNGTVVGKMTAVDPDRERIVYTLPSPGPFDIDPGTGVLTLGRRELLDFETKPFWNVPVKATDTAGTSVTVAAIVNLSNVDDYTTVRREHGFKPGTSYFANSYGFSEKWFLDRSNLWHVILPGGVIRKADAGARLDQGTLIGTLGAAAHADPTLFFNANAVITQSAQASLTQLRKDYGFRLQGSLWTNSAGFQEKWIVDRSGAWHVILPTGEIRKADTANLFNGTFVAQVDPLVYDDPSALFNAPVALPDAMNAQLSQLRKDHGFFVNGSDWLNASGYREKWLMDRSGAWYVMLPNGELRKADNARLDQGTLKASLDPLVYDDLTKLTQAPVSLTTTQTDALSQLRKENGFRTTGNFYVNASGYREKWIQDRSGAWFVLLPNGEIRKVDAGTNLRNGTLKTTVDPLVYDDPTLLLNAPLSLTQAAKDKLSLLRQQNGFFVNGNDWFNSSGFQERWLQDRAGAWYVLLPNGELRKANAGSNLRNGTLVDSIDVLAYDDVKLLTAAPVTLPTATQTTIAQLKIDYGFQLKGSLYFNSYGYREKWFADRTGFWYVILTNGQIRKVDAGGNLTAGSLKGTVDPLVWDDPSVLFA